MLRKEIGLLTLTALLGAVGCGGEVAPPGGGRGAPAVQQAAATAPAFPLRTSPNGRYLEDQNGVPVPILGRTAWFAISLSAADFGTFLGDTLSRGYNAIELQVLDHDPRGNNPPRNGNGDLPFSKRLDGASWSGSLTYGNIDAEAPDFTTPNEAYWRFVDDFLATCESQGVLVFFFPAYVGYAGGEQGWMQELVANGTTRVNQYGAFLANRYKGRKNIVWMMGGDMGTGNTPFSSAQVAVESALIDGLKSVSGQSSTHFSAEWDSNSICTDQTTFAGNCTLQAAYSWTGQVVAYARNGYAHTPVMPSFLLEEPFDEEGPDGNNYNPSATQPVRRFQIWGWLSGIAGYVSGNGYVWAFRSGWQTHLNTQGAQDMARLNALIRSVSWSELVPSGLGGMKTLVTAGGGTYGGSDYVAAAATPSGRLLLAYVPPTGTAGRSFTVDMTAMSGPVLARWWNPTSGAYTDIGSSLPNTGTRSFSTPGDNGTGQNDWLLVLTSDGASAPPTVATPASASPNPVSGTSTSLSVLGSDDGGEANLVYTWATTGTPPAPVSFSVNGTNAAKNTTATFGRAGSYTVQATIQDLDGQTSTSLVTVTVNQTLTAIAVTPASATVAPNGSQQFSATASDQFGVAMATQPAFGWAVSGGGTISSSGLFTAGSTAGGPFTVTASAGGKIGSASVTVSSGTVAVARYQTNCGGAAAGTFASDQLFSGGSTYSTSGTVATSGVVNPAPAAVYLSERWGNHSYTYGGLTPGAAYTVRLHFAEIWWTAAGSRLFNVSINGAQVLTNFDILAAAGGAFRALVRDFSADANGNGQIVIQYTTVKDNAKSSGIEILASGSANAAPTVATPASASPNPVSGTSTSLSVLGADDGGEASLVYTWTTTGTPPAPVTFGANGTNAAKNTTATFTRTGTYGLLVTIKDASGATATSAVSVTVTPTLTSITVAPASASVAPGGTAQFTATARDQFGVALATQPAFGWTVSGGGTVSSSGLFTAGSGAGGPFTVTASSGGRSGTATVTVVGTTLRVDAGGAAAGGFSADTAFSGGSAYVTTNAIDASGVTNPAPAAVYQSERYGSFGYAFSGLAPGATYTVRLHFAEIYWTSTGMRLFDVSINGAQVLANFDIVAAAGGANRALVKEFTVAASANGGIWIGFAPVKDLAKISGIEILGP